jgi:hypothetical protein
MPQFYFEFRNAAECIRDDEGAELADTVAAHAVALASLRDVLAGDIFDGVLDTASTIEVMDEFRQPVMTLSFDQAVRLVGRAQPISTV